MSVRKTIRTVESLEVGESLSFEDDNGRNYSGSVVEIQDRPYKEYKAWLVKGDDGTEDCVLRVWYDIEGGPTNVDVSFEDGSSEEVVSVEN